MASSLHLHPGEVDIQVQPDHPGGRIGVSDVIADDDLTPEARIAASWENCAAGALTRGEYHDGLAAAGLTEVKITETHDVGPGLHGAIIQARR